MVLTSLPFQQRKKERENELIKENELIEVCIAVVQPSWFLMFNLMDAMGQAG